MSVGGPDPRTALVTGAAGFIGSHLVEHLLNAGWRVRGFDDLSVGCLDNLQSMLGLPDFELVTGSVLDEGLIASAVGGVTHVFHLAGRLGAEYVEQNAEKTVTESIRATQALLSAVRPRRVPLFLASTSEIYGDSAEQPLAEDFDIIIAPPTSPRSSYALGKGVGELLVNEYMRREQGHAVIGRLFNTIGPRQSGRYGQVVPQFIERAMTGRPILIQGDGRQTRSFTFVGDTVAAMVATLTTPAASGQTVNIGSQEETPIIDLARLVTHLTGSSSPICYLPYERAHRPGARDVHRRVPNTDRLRWLTGLQCTTPLATAIKSILGSSTRLSR